MAREHADWVAELFGGLDAGDGGELMRLLGRLKTSVRTAIDDRKDHPTKDGP
jgi:hypothetical protein